jgi:hypothetical protein
MDMTSLFPDRRYPYTPRKQVSSVADPKCSSRIPNPKTSTKERGEKKIDCHTFFCSHKFHKIENYFIFEMLKKKKFGPVF